MKRFGLVAIICCLSMITSSAFAGGLEYNGAGARALGRGGAFAARADDPMALQYNQARMVDLEGSQLLLSFNAAFYSFCFDRAGFYNDGIGSDAQASRFGATPGDWAYQAYPRVCNETPFSPAGSVVFTHRFNDQWAIGVGLLTPTTVANVRMGAADGTVNGGALPNPGRYALQQQNHLFFWPTVAAAYKPLRWLRLGAGFQWGIARIDSTNYINVGLRSENSPEDPVLDLRTQYVGYDWFVPAVIGSVDIEPMDGLNFMVGFRWSDSIKADGDLHIRSGDYAATQSPDFQSESTTSDVTLSVPQPWSLSFGARYAFLRPSAIERRASENDDGDATSATATAATAHDPMRDEVFDLEVDVVFERNSMMTAFGLDVPAGATRAPIGPGGRLTANPFPTPALSPRLPHHWNDQVSLRIGGDWNAIANKLALRAGFSYETNGVDARYAQIDFFPSQRFGLHAGATVRLMERLDLTLAYAHVFQQAVVTGVDEQAYPQVAVLGAGDPRMVNAGKYTAAIDVLSISAGYRF